MGENPPILLASLITNKSIANELKPRVLSYSYAVQYTDTMSYKICNA
ncbi:hypothetical protein FDUTEX481_06741 [Tolypothrix sp. PCC 7601]|nr:hypothetical protein FDUTEX481_06741 [Tolypothrix sp. PCC 7601]